MTTHQLEVVIEDFVGFLTTVLQVVWLALMELCNLVGVGDPGISGLDVFLLIEMEKFNKS